MKTETISGTYQPIVAIKDIEDFRSKSETAVFGDRRDGKLYRYWPKAKLAINIALATGRPLLILGASGCGKSSLAFNLARVMRRRYYEFVVTSRSQARDLVYRFDAVRRLGDAQMHAPRCANTEGAIANDDLSWRMNFPYIEPAPLWWIIDNHGAQRRGYDVEGNVPFPPAIDPVVWEPQGQTPTGSLLLIDEIDKAEPDFPNNLLVPIGSWQFVVEEIGKTVSIKSDTSDQERLDHPLVIITSNQQRELPDTFLRRCIVLEITPPTPGELVELAITTFGPREDGFYETVANRLQELHENELSVAEFLDSVRAIQKLQASGSTLTEIVERSSWRSVER